MTVPRTFAAHLLRRAGFAATPASIDAIAALPSKTAAVDQLIATATTAPLPTQPSLQGFNDTNEADTKIFVTWWLDQMRAGASPLREKLTLFWHGHFTSSRFTVLNVSLMARQNQLFRTNALGNFRTLTQAAAIDPAMLIYLDNVVNRTPTPNENFARELMELFTIGVGNYTEADVQAAARAWTGHNMNSARTAYQFFSTRHDATNKTFLGVTKNWNGPDIIDQLLTVEPHRTISARYLATKLWSFLAYTGPDSATIDTITAAYLAANLSIAALVRAIFLHPNFDTDVARTNLLRTPTDFVAAALTATGVPAGDVAPHDAMANMGQSLLAPPNVSGWRSNYAWISSLATAARGDYARTLARTAAGRGFLADVLRLPPARAVPKVFEAFGIVDPSPASRALVDTWLRGSRVRSKYDPPTAPLAALVMCTPEFNLA